MNYHEYTKRAFTSLDSKLQPYIFGTLGTIKNFCPYLWIALITCLGQAHICWGKQLYVKVIGPTPIHFTSYDTRADKLLSLQEEKECTIIVVLTILQKWINIFQMGLGHLFMRIRV